MRSREQYLGTLIPRYLKAGRRGKTSLLDEYCINTGQNRKYVIRKIRKMAFGEPKPRKRRGRRYGHEVQEALWKIWKIFDGPCGQRLQPLLEREVGRLRALGELKVSGETYEKLLSIGSATIDRLLGAKREGRYETEEELHLINDLYRNELRLYKNFFQPVMKLVRKERIDGRTKRKYDRPKRPPSGLKAQSSGMLVRHRERPGPGDVQRKLSFGLYAQIQGMDVQAS